MSDQVSVSHVQQYNANVISLFQQRGSRLRGTVREHQLVGKVDFWDRIGPTEAYEITSRGADTQIVNTPHSRRKVVMRDWGWADLVDPIDVIRMLTDPQSEYAQNAARAMGRRFDRQVISAFDADAAGDVDGGTAVTFASEKAGDEDFSGAALTVANLTKVKSDLDTKDVDQDGRHIVFSPAALAQLLKQSTVPNVSSSDYNTIKALVNGEINTYLGFQVHMTTLLPVPSSTLRYCYAWHEQAMGVSVGKDIGVSVDKRPDKNNNMQVFSNFSFGSTRIQGEGVVRFKIDEAN